MKLNTGIQWLDQLLPEGIVAPSSTLISGPGGTGKPLVGFACGKGMLDELSNIADSTRKTRIPEIRKI